MSSTTDSSSGADPLNPIIGIFGGIPTNRDLAPSAIFLVAFTLLMPVALWRGLTPKYRTWILLRPNIFIMARMATWIVRIVIATENYYNNNGLFVAELVLEISGFNIICEPLVRVLEQNLHASAYNAGVQEPKPILKILGFMRMGLLVSLILGIYTGTQYSGGLTNDQANTLNNYRLATTGINVSIVSLTIIFSLLLHRQYSCSTRATAFVAGVGAVLIIPSAYRLDNVVSAYDNFGTRTKVMFYVLSALPEFVGTVPFLACNLHEVFDLEYKHSGGGGPLGAVFNGVSRALGRNQSEHVNHPPRNLPQMEQGQYYGSQPHVGYNSATHYPNENTEADYK